MNAKIACFCRLITQSVGALLQSLKMSESQPGDQPEQAESESTPAKDDSAQSETRDQENAVEMPLADSFAKDENHDDDEDRPEERRLHAHLKRRYA